MAASIPTLLTTLGASTASTAMAATAAAVGVASQVQSIQAKKKKAKQASRDADEKSELLKVQYAQDETDRKQRLKTALSSQKALFGARGISSSSGSALALATRALEDSRASANLNQQKNALQLNQIRRGNGFSQTRAVLGASGTLLNKLK